MIRETELSKLIADIKRMKDTYSDRELTRGLVVENGIWGVIAVPSDLKDLAIEMFGYLGAKAIKISPSQRTDITEIYFDRSAAVIVFLTMQDERKFSTEELANAILQQRAGNVDAFKNLEIQKADEARKANLKNLVDDLSVVDAVIKKDGTITAEEIEKRLATRYPRMSAARLENGRSDLAHVYQRFLEGELEKELSLGKANPDLQALIRRAGEIQADGVTNAELGELTTGVLRYADSKLKELSQPKTVER